ncbi:MAG: ABC transporter permease subunit [Streptomycetaceae bacterium]|nr:ABC transporter permease subunit [Streptomycetaceae bacterium]
MSAEAGVAAGASAPEGAARGRTKSPSAPRRSLPALPSWAGGLVGLAVVLLVWTVLALTVLEDGGAVPTPLAVAKRLADDGWDFYEPHVSGTAWEAARGYFWGNLLAIGLAVVAVLLPFLERLITQLAVASYCLPIIAIGPILMILLDGDKPIVTLAAQLCFFTTLTGALAGLRAADQTSLDLVRAYGGGRWQQMRRVRLIAALPATFAALRIAAPAAVLGAIIGEYMGRVEQGLGLAMIVAQQQLNADRTWGVALVSAALAGVGYAIVALVGRVVTPWAKDTGVGGGR